MKRIVRLTIALAAVLTCLVLAGTAGAYAAAHNISEAELITIKEKVTTVKGTTIMTDGTLDDYDYYKFKTENVPGVTYKFRSINVGNNDDGISCMLLDKEGNDVYSQEDGIRNSWAYEPGKPQKTSTFKLKKNSTYYIRVGAYPTPGEFPYKMQLSFSYDKPGKGKVTSLKSPKKKTMVAKWKKVTNAAKYQVAYKVKGGKWIKKTTTKKSMTVKKLKAKKTYYFKVRAIRKVAGKTLYGDWSSAKKVKIKK